MKQSIIFDTLFPKASKLLFLLLFFSSCNDLFVDSNPKNNAINNFELLWKEFDQNYCYFQEKGIDWNVVYDRYRPLVHNDMSDEELFEVMARMLGELKDGHVNLIAPFNISKYWDWYLDYPQNFNYTIIERNYLKKDMIMINGMMAQKLDGNIGYIYYEGFTEYEQDGIDYILTKFKDCRAVIFDIRNNGGGYAETMFKLVSHFTDKEVRVGYTRYKNGKGHNDFSKWNEEIVKPGKGIRYTKPVIVLTNRSSYSAANIFAGIMKHLPHVTIVGDHTGGGGASPRSFPLMNEWIARQSSICFADTNKETFEFGVAPDITVSLNPSDEAKGIDTIIEYACSLD